MAKLPTPFRYRGGWRAQVTLKNGSRPHQDFDKQAEANEWIAQQLALRDSENAPELGGPKQATLAQALFHYAGMYTIVKGGRKAELDRINHYLLAAGIPQQRFVMVDDKIVMEDKPIKKLPSAFKAHKDARLEQRVQTYAMIGMLANRRVSTLTKADMRKFMVCMTTEGLSDSSIQKEIALLKHLFNMAEQEWNWKGFENPCDGLKLKGSNIRFVVMTTEQKHALRKALAECDNPYFWPMVEVSLETTLRKGSLLTMSRENVDLEGRIARLWAKGRLVDVPLTKKTVEILKDLPPHVSGKYFPMTPNAVDLAWDGVRQKIGMPKLQFRDLRHVGATEYARAGMNAGQLRKQLGHTTNRMSEVYCNLVAQDSLDVLDRIALTQTVFALPPPADGPAEHIMGRNKAQRLTNALLAKAKQSEADALGMEKPSAEPTMSPTMSSTNSPAYAASQKAVSGGAVESDALDATAIFLRTVGENLSAEAELTVGACTPLESSPDARSPVSPAQASPAEVPPAEATHAEDPASRAQTQDHQATGTDGAHTAIRASAATPNSNVIRVSFGRKK